MTKTEKVLMKEWEQERELLKQELKKYGNLEEHFLEVTVHPEIYDKERFGGKRCLQERVINCRFNPPDGWHFPIPKDLNYDGLKSDFENGCLVYAIKEIDLPIRFGITTSGLFCYQTECSTEYDKPEKGLRLLLVELAFRTIHSAVKFMNKFYRSLDPSSSIRIFSTIFDTYNRLPTHDIFRPFDKPIGFYLEGTDKLIEDSRICFDLTTTRQEISSNPIDVVFKLMKNFVSSISANMSDEQLLSLIERIEAGDISAFRYNTSLKKSHF